MTFHPFQKYIVLLKPFINALLSPKKTLKNVVKGRNRERLKIDWGQLFHQINRTIIFKEIKEVQYKRIILEEINKDDIVNM